MEASDEYLEIRDAMNFQSKKLRHVYDSIVLESFDQISELCRIRINIIAID